MNKKINKYLSFIGIEFPSYKESLSVFNKASVDYQLKLNEKHLDPFKILEELNNETISIEKKSLKNKTLTKSQSFFRRLVLAAEVVNKCYQESRFGSVKFQKLVYLCEQVTNMSFCTYYSKQAAGPFDRKFMHSVKSGFQKQKWFEIKKVENGNKQKVIFIPMENQLGYKEYYNRYYGQVDDGIQYILETFCKSYTAEVELVATIFASWIEIINKQEIFSDKLLIEKIYNWHPNKSKFSKNEIIKTKDWMNENGICPS